MSYLVRLAIPGLIVMLMVGSTVRQACAQEMTIRMYTVIEEDKKSKFDFALSYAERLFERPEIKKQGCVFEIVAVGKAFVYLIDGRSPITNRYKRCLKKGWNVKLVGCGKSVKTMKEYLKDGKTRLLPGVQLIPDCRKYEKSKLDGDWHELSIPSEV